MNDETIRKLHFSKKLNENFDINSNDFKHFSVYFLVQENIDLTSKYAFDDVYK